jgi:hypothetical protein
MNKDIEKLSSELPFHIDYVKDAYKHCSKSYYKTKTILEYMYENEMKYTQENISNAMLKIFNTETIPTEKIEPVFDHKNITELSESIATMYKECNDKKIIDNYVSEVTKMLHHSSMIQIVKG